MIALKRDLASTVRKHGDRFEEILFEGVGPLDAGGRVALRRLSMDRIDYSDPLFVAENVIDEWKGRIRRAEPFQLGTVAPFTDRGFAWFARAIDLGAVWRQGQSWPVWGMSWGRGLVPTVQEEGIVEKPGVVVIVWGAADQAAREQGLAAVPLGYGIAAYGGWFRPETMIEVQTFGADALTFYDGDRGDKAAGSNIMTMAHTLWQMLDERILVRAKVPLGRADRRLAKRAGLDDLFVTTIHLRNREYVGERYEGAAGREFSHQFPVRGHIRTLHRGTPMERQVPVRAHIRGPKDKPFVAKDHVYSLDR